MQKQKYDAVVGDTTITANRTSFVDFRLPYIESGVVMVVRIKDEKASNIWIFLKPLSWDLWLATVATFIFTRLVIFILEYHRKTDFKVPPNHQLGNMFKSFVSTLVFCQYSK